MSKIVLTLSDQVVRGKQVSFVAPCASGDAECLVINSVEYSISDSNGYPVSHFPGLWSKDSIVSVILDTDAGRAYIQNPAGGRVGVPTAGGGEVFGDYATNEASGKFASAFGTETKAMGEASFAHGKKIFRSDADYIHSKEYRSPSDANGHEVEVRVYYTDPDSDYALVSPTLQELDDIGEYLNEKEPYSCWQDFANYEGNEPLMRMSDGRYISLSDYRYNEAYGTGAMAAGKGAVAYSRASKSFGYRTQTGYPLSPEMAALRPEAILHSLPFTISQPEERDYNADIDRYTFVYEDHIEFKGMGGSVVYTMSSGKLMFNVSGSVGYHETPGDNYIVLFADYYRAINGDGSYDVIKEMDQYDIYNDSEFIVLEVPVGTSYIRLTCTDNMGICQVQVKISDFQYFPADNKGQGAFAIGADTVALNNHDFAGGWGSIARGWHSFSFGGHCESSKEYAASFGNYSKASGYAAFAIGDHCESSAENTFAGGFESKASSGNSIAFGYRCTASTRRTVALGSEANASGEMGAAAIGHQVTAIGKGATAMGSGTYAKGEGTFAVGSGTKATLYGASAFGDKCTASNYNALAGGASSVASHANSFAFGRGVATSRSSQFVIGQDNAEAKGALFVVGNGTRDTNGNITSQTNAFVVEATGNATLQGGLNGVYMKTWKNNSNMMHIKSKFDSWSTLNKDKRQSFFVFGILCPDNNNTVGAIVQGTIMVTGDCKATWYGTEGITLLDKNGGQFIVLFPHPVFDYITVISAEKFALE